MLRLDMRPVLLDSYQNISAAEWNRLAASSQPFLKHAFLAGLETSDCATAHTGWAPHILALEQDNTLTAALPLYAKSHSMGEFVFDWAWADAYARHGLAYYPKLVSAVPFSPIQGPRLLGAERDTLLDAALSVTEIGGYSSLHILFPDPSELPAYEARGLLIRRGVQFHWRNDDYRDFNDFLDSLTREKRKKIKQEQRRVAEADIRFELLTGKDIQPQHMAFAYHCYANTYAVRGRQPYLTPKFFEHLHATMAENLLLVLALRDDGAQTQPIAMALNFYTDDTLWGRYWGCIENVSCLHFDACYYQAIEFCIARGIHLFEGGAQGEHKLARGFMPTTTYSAHWIAHPNFRDAIARFLKQESLGIEEYMDELNEHAPFKAEK
ncbi:MAG TPA: GNAT family N-acetyltransferase [Rhodocyclaceae bacterium]|jgi:predicted N-acyltransferase|nr:GNAT family N-acetyltransferase [Rhodocyclaceae bacterium]